jgi:glycosyltransferase involved in cell wall biosynthesis
MQTGARIDEEHPTLDPLESAAVIARQPERRRYRFGFVLSTSLGNLTRFENLKKYAERDAEVDIAWAPVKHYLAPGEPDRFRWLPGALRARAIVLQQAWPVLGRLGAFDAVMIHMYEVDLLTALRGYLFRKPLRIVSSDDAPVVDPGTYPLHPVDRAKPAWRRAIRLRLDLWRARRADLLVPFSEWAGRILVDGARVEAAKVMPLHVGLDLEVWTCPPRAPAPPATRAKLLFVGGEFARKGGPQLLAAFERDLGDIAELHLVTKSAPPALPPHVHVHADMVPNDPRLTRLYREADMLVHPTTSDLSPWVVLEAMASGLPVVTTPIAGIVECVEEGRTGLLVPVGDPEALARAIRSLIDDPERRRSMGAAARRRIEQHFNAAINVPRILGFMKALVERERGGTLQAASSTEGGR